MFDAASPSASELPKFNPARTLSSTEASLLRRLLRAKPTRVQFMKSAFGASMLLAAAYGLASQRGYVASNNAVVSANVVSVRVPLDGYISELSVGVGTKVAKQDGIGRVENPRINDQYLVELRQSIQRALVDADANTDLRNRLLQERQSLETRNRSFLDASTSRLEQVERQEQQQVASKLALQDELQLKVERQRKLFHDGIISRADLDQLERQYAVADHDRQAEHNALDAVHTQASASSRGILLDSGTNGGSYAQQRIDEIDMRLADVNHLIVQSREEAKVLQQGLIDATANLDLRRGVELLAPVDGVVWKLIASDGEHVEKGDRIAQFVDCKSGFVVAAIPQDRVPDIEIGGMAKFRLSGETSDRYGRVSSVTGERNESTDADLAATPVHERNPTATVFISQLNNDNSGECMVGRTARVLLPINRTGLLSELRVHTR